MQEYTKIRTTSYAFIKMKELNEGQIDGIIKLKFGRLVTEAGHLSYASNKVLGQIFGLS